jgi:PiT family inorganic phosphate transporter
LERPGSSPDPVDAPEDRPIESLNLMLIAVLVLAVVFDYINGFHDTANAIATSVATRALRPQYALLMATAFNFIGAFAGTAVAKTIGAGLVDEQTTTQVVVASALIGAIVWNLITWWLGLPSSSSHALIGGLLGATAIAVGTSAFKLDGVVNKVLVPLVTSPIAGFLIALVLMVVLTWIFRGAARKPLGAAFRRLQVFSAGYMAFAHGSNDAQKTMGIITVLLIAAGLQQKTSHVTPQIWVVLACQAAMALGTLSGGWRIVKTMGMKITKLRPVGGFCAETAGSITLALATFLGVPVSTTHTITGSIVGVGTAERRLSAVRWGVAGRIVWAWIFTIPAAALIAVITYLAIRAISGTP